MARNSASTAPLPSVEASHWWSPEAITTAPRLLTFDPDVTVQRARWSVGVVDRAMSLPPGRCRREMAFVAAPQLRPGFPDRVLERIGERCRRGRNDVRVAAHRRPFVRAVRRVDDHPGPGGGSGIAVQDPHLVVDEVDVVE